MKSSIQQVQSPEGTSCLLCDVNNLTLNIFVWLFITRNKQMILEGLEKKILSCSECFKIEFQTTDSDHVLTSEE